LKNSKYGSSRVIIQGDSTFFLQKITLTYFEKIIFQNTTVLELVIIPEIKHFLSTKVVI
jgi:hypothetical protein